MKDGIKAGENTEVSRQEVYEDYVNCFLELCTEVGPCREDRVLEKAAQYLLREREPSGTFTLFPFYQSVGEGCSAQNEINRMKFLSAFIKATEVLETLCVNLVIQPWKKEIKTLKTFTGPFVYCLVPVLSSSSIQSVLASIGYLPHTDTPPSEYKLSEDANQERAMLMGFELLLARVECYHLLERHDLDQMQQKEWLEVLQKRVGPTKLEEPTDKNTTIGQEEEEEEKKEEAEGKEVPLHLDSRIVGKPQPKPRRSRITSPDQSLMEMQLTYPDLAFKGRPLRSSKAVHTFSTYNKSDEVFVDDVRNSGCNGGSSGGTAAPGDNISCSFCSTDEGRVNNEFSYPQSISPHIKMRAGSTAEQSLKPGEPQPTAEPEQQTAADNILEKRLANRRLSSLSSTDEEQELRELEERMSQRKQDDKRGEENPNKYRRKKERQATTEGKAEEQKLRKPVMETGPVPSHAANRYTTSSQSDAAVMKEQKQPSVCHPSLQTAITRLPDCQSCHGGSKGQQGEDTKRAETSWGEEEQLAQSYVIVDHHKK